jgi:hypothetical protein
LTEKEKVKQPKKYKKNPSKPDPIEKRLDALIRLFIEMNKPKVKEDFNEGTAARLLQSVDFSPTEIAKILGKKSRTDVAQYLYDKKAPTTKVKSLAKNQKNNSANNNANQPKKGGVIKVE